LNSTPESCGRTVAVTIGWTVPSAVTLTGMSCRVAFSTLTAAAGRPRDSPPPRWESQRAPKPIRTRPRMTAPAMSHVFVRLDPAGWGDGADAVA
jgi:hypothetical protein